MMKIGFSNLVARLALYDLETSVSEPMKGALGTVDGAMSIYGWPADEADLVPYSVLSDIQSSLSSPDWPLKRARVSIAFLFNVNPKVGPEGATKYQRFKGFSTIATEYYWTGMDDRPEGGRYVSMNNLNVSAALIYSRLMELGHVIMGLVVRSYWSPAGRTDTPERERSTLRGVKSPKKPKGGS